MIPKIILSTEPTKANIYPALRADPRGGLAPSRLQYGVNTGHIPSSIPLGKTGILISSDSTYHQREHLFLLRLHLLLFSALSLLHSLKHTLAQSGFPLLSYLKAASLLCFFAKALRCCRCGEGLSVPDRA